MLFDFRKYCTLEKEIADTLAKCKCVRSTHPKPPGAVRCRAAMLLCATQAMGNNNLNNIIKTFS